MLCYTRFLTYESWELTQAPGHVQGEDSAVTLLERQVGQVVWEAAQLLGHTGVAQVEQDVQAQGLEGGKVALPAGVVKLNTDRVLLVLGQTEHLQVVVAHKVLCLTASRSIACTWLRVQEEGLNTLRASLRRNSHFSTHIHIKSWMGGANLWH